MCIIFANKTYLQCEGVLCGEKISCWLVSTRHPLQHLLSALLLFTIISYDNLSLLLFIIIDLMKKRPDVKVFGGWSVACLGPQPTSHGLAPMHLYLQCC